MTDSYVYILVFLAHRIRISKILPWDIQSYIAQEHRLGTLSQKLEEGINTFNGISLSHSSDVDQVTQMFGLHKDPY